MALVELTNDRVTSVKLRYYPEWAIRGLGDYGASMSKTKRLFGPPSRSAKRMGTGHNKTWWVYTDKIESEKTLLLTFDDKGHLYGSQIGPNRTDFDELANK